MDQSVIFDLVPGLTVIAKRFDFQVAKGEEAKKKSMHGKEIWGGKIAWGLRLSGSLPSHTLDSTKVTLY